MNKAPAFQWYPDKALADTRRLSWKTKGIYRELEGVIWMQFQDTCSIPDDNDFIHKELGCTKEEWLEAKTEIMWDHRPLLELKNGRLVSNDLLEKKLKQAAHRQKQAENGRKGGRPKNLKNNEEKAVGFSNETQTESKKSLSSPSSSPSPSVELKKPPSGVKKTRLVRSAFLVTPQMRTWAAGKGVQEVDSQTEAFLDHHEANASLFSDWTAAWRTWMRKHLEWRKNKPQPWQAEPTKAPPRETCMHAGCSAPWVIRRNNSPLCRDHADELYSENQNAPPGVPKAIQSLAGSIGMK